MASWMRTKVFETESLGVAFLDRDVRKYSAKFLLEVKVPDDPLNFRVAKSEFNFSYSGVLSEIHKYNWNTCSKCSNYELLDVKSERTACHGSDEVADESKEQSRFLCVRCETSDVKQCPVCFVFVSRIDGCNLMTCRCNAQWCYCCGGERFHVRIS
jgi:hypothetical protein